MSKNYKTIIWDWNGTLLNDVWLCIEIVNRLLKNHNDVQLDEARYKAVFGFPITEYYHKIGIDLKKESFESLTKKFIADYDIGVKQCNLHESVVETLTTFNDNNLDQYILTAAHKESVISLLNNFGISKYFKEIEGLDNHRAESKMNRGIELLRKNEIDAKTAVLVGDTIHDYEVAMKIGVDCILIANGHQSKHRLMGNANAHVVDCLDHLDTLF